MPTTNPVPSNDPTDLLFNAQKLDQVVNGSAQYYTDRLGVNRRTMEGISAAADVVLGGLGYAPPVTYASGISMTLTTQTVEYSGEIYAPKVASLPFTTSTWATDSAKFRLIQGVAATDLAASGGAGMIGYMPAGTGAVATTVQEMFRRSVSVADYMTAEQRADVTARTALLDVTLAFHLAQTASSTITLPPGKYLVSGIRQLVDDLILIGNGVGQTEIYAPSGVALYNYEGQDSDAPQRVGLRIENLTMRGGYNNPDDFTAPANSWAAASGLAKSFTTANPNTMLRLKRVDRVFISNVHFKDMHVGIDIYAGIFSGIYECLFKNGQIGIRCNNAATWGDSSYKTTTLTIRKNRFEELWVGQWLNELVDDSRSYENVFEPCNTGQYIFNGGSERGTNTLSDYFERCYEGIVFDGGHLSNWRIVDPYFAGYKGWFWGYGYSINVMPGVSASARIRIDADAMGGGGMSQQSNCKILAPSLRSVGGYVVKNLYLDDFVNNPIYPDPLLTRHGRLIDYGAGITGKTITSDTVDGSVVLEFSGSNTGLAYNGLRLLNSGTRTAPLRIRYSYQYSGTTTNFTPFGVFIDAPYSGFVGSVVYGDTGGKWVDVDMSFDDAGAIAYANANAQGGFNGIFKIKNLFISEGYGPAQNYPTNPTLISDQSSPFTGRAFVADRAQNQSPTVGQPKGWVCTVSGTPGTWVSEGNL